MIYNILIIGTGGTGGMLIGKLGRYLSGRISGDDRFTVTLADGDIVEKKNLLRQPFFPEDIGENKASILAEAITAAFGVPCQASTAYVDSVKDLENLFEAGAELYRSTVDNRYFNSLDCCYILIGCVDNHAARKVMHDYFVSCIQKHTRLIYIDSANEFSDGQVVFGATAGGKLQSPDRAMFYPDILYSDDKPRSEESCEVLNASAPQHIVVNDLMATIILSGLSLIIENGILPNGVVQADALRFSMSHMPYREGKKRAGRRKKDNQ